MFYKWQKVLNSFSFITILIISLAFITSVAFAAPARHPGWVKGQILVQTRTGLSHGRFKKMLGSQFSRSKRQISGINVHVVSVPMHAEDRVIEALSRNPDIEFAEKDRYHELNDYIPDDPQFSSAWHLQTMNVPQAWDVTRGSGVTVAVLDTGVNSSHEDLSGKLVTGRNVVSNNYDTEDVYGHGTNVAGVIGAAMDNGLGVASIAPDVMIMPIRITNSTDGWATTSAMADGLAWAADHGARVANISYEATSSRTVRTAADYMRDRGGIVVSSAGNSGSDTGQADSTSIITVSATNSRDALTGWSNYGDVIDVAAPGAGLWTTHNNGGYAAVSGTSFSAPATAATVAMIMAVNSSLGPDEVEGILEGSAIDLGSAGWDSEFGHGRVDTLRAVMQAGVQTTVDSQPPVVSLSAPADGAVVEGTLSVSVTASDNAGVVRVELYADDRLVGKDYSAPYNFSWDSDTAGEGTIVVLQAVAHDSSGNSAQQSVSVHVRDVSPPVISVPVDIVVEATGQLTGVVLGTASASDNVDGPVAVTAGNTGPFAVGVHDVTWSAIDAAGNTATATQTVTVRDTTAPAVTAPPDISVPATGVYTDVALGQAAAVDLVDGALAALPGTTGPFTAGRHTVTWQARDAAGNTGLAMQRVTILPVDAVPPTITAPPNITVEATGALTYVDIGTALAIDAIDGPVAVTPGTTGPFPPGVTIVTWTASDTQGNIATATQRITLTDTTAPLIEVPADITVGATGVLSDVDLGQASAYDSVSGPLKAVADETGPFASGLYAVTWSATDAAGNTASAIQMVTVLPQADFAIDQTVGEGSEVGVSVHLSGTAPDYPVIIPYTVSGTAVNPHDHNAVDGELVISSGTTGSLAFRTVDDGVNGESANTVIFTLQTPESAVAGTNAVHTVTIIEENAPPVVDLVVTQSGVLTRTVYPDQGPVVVNARVRDPNPADVHHLDWSLTDNRLVSDSGSDAFEFTIDPQYLAPGIYTLRVMVTDSGVFAETVSVDIALNVAAVMPLLGNAADQDGDGLSDAAEGTGDADQDGVPDYLDGIDNPAVLQGIDSVSSHHLLVADSGVQLRLGTTALGSSLASAVVQVEDLPVSGGDGATGLEFPGGVFDFVLAGLSEPGQSVRVVLPQFAPLVPGAVYRKYFPGSGWQDFVVDAGNAIASAPGSAGACPSPGDAAYRSGLHAGDYCIRLTLEDGGPNDTDGLRNGVIRDPGGAGVVPQAVGDSDSAGGGGGGGGGGCSVNPAAKPDPVWLILLMWLVAGYTRRRCGKPGQ